MRMASWLALVAGCLMVGCASAYAQEESAQAPAAAVQAPRTGPDHDAREMVEVILAARLAKELGLNDEQTVLMLRRFSSYREQVNALRKDRQDRLKALKASVKSGESDELITAKLNDLMDQDVKMAEFRKMAYEKASEGLTATQRAKLYVFVNEFEGDMRKLVQQARERSHRRGPLAEPRNQDAPPRPPRLPRPRQEEPVPTP